MTVIEVRQTEIFARWLAKLRDGRAQARINARIRRLSIGNPGDAKSVGGGVVGAAHRLRSRLLRLLCSFRRSARYPSRGW